MKAHDTSEKKVKPSSFIYFEKISWKILLYIIRFLFFIKYVIALYQKTYFSINLNAYYTREKRIKSSPAIYFKKKIIKNSASSDHIFVFYKICYFTLARSSFPYNLEMYNTHTHTHTKHVDMIDFEKRYTETVFQQYWKGGGRGYRLSLSVKKYEIHWNLKKPPFFNLKIYT